MAPLIEGADWAICHQETPVSDDNVGLAGYPRFNAPFQLAEAQKAVGFDACSTASNHTVDLGLDGITATLDTLDRVGIRHTGSARSRAESARPDLYDVQGVMVGHLSDTYSLNGLPSPAPWWAVNLIDPERIRSDAAAIRRAGADIVVVSLHFGEEMVSTPSAYQPADLVRRWDRGHVQVDVDGPDLPRAQRRPAACAVSVRRVGVMGTYQEPCSASAPAEK